MSEFSNMSKSELLDLRNAITKTIDIYQDRLEFIILNENPLPRDIADAKLQITRLLNIQNTLTTLIAGKILTDLENAGERISNTTQKLKEALAKLKEINKILEIVALFINLSNAIIGAITGTSAVAGIAGIINVLDPVLNNSTQEPAQS